MHIGEVCTREVVCAAVDTSVAAAAKLMRQYHIGDVVVVQENGGKRMPLGIVTDRDITIGVVAAELDANTITVGDIMGAELVTAGESEDVFATVRRMRSRGVRRMPIVDEDGALTGIVSIDDLIEILAEELGALAHLIAREQVNEQRTRR